MTTTKPVSGNGTGMPYETIAEPDHAVANGMLYASPPFTAGRTTPGFREPKTLPIGSDYWRLYRLDK